MTALDPKALEAANMDVAAAILRVINSRLPFKESRACPADVAKEAAIAALSALNREDVVERCKDAVQTYSWSTDGSGSFVFRGDDPNSEAIERFENRVDAFDRAQELNARAVLAELGIGEG